jgi:WD40 repeat protein/transcriptional regulator with XRE-family HTH domain
MERTASFGYWLRRWRKALDLTQEALARRVGCAAITIRKIEADELRPSRQIAERLAECLDISPAERAAFIRVARAELSVDHLELPARPPARTLPTRLGVARLPLDRTQNIIAPTNPIPTIDNPYMGLRAFGEADAANFFGCEMLIQRLLDRFREQTDLARFLAVIGPSGSGKSSVVRAGLIPALRRGQLPGSEHWLIADLLPGAHPFEELEAALLRVAANPPASLLEQLLADTRGLARAVKRVLPADNALELLLVIDQFEEVFTLASNASRSHLLDSLVTAMLDEHSRMRVLITLRADFVDRPLQYVDFGELICQRSELVLALTPDELEHAIVGPAERTGLALEPGLVATIVRDVRDQPAALPLLQYALTELFERRVGHMLTLTSYHEIGGVAGALVYRADAVYLGLDQPGQEVGRQLFLRLITLGEGVPDTRRRVRRSELALLVGGQLRTMDDEDVSDRLSSVAQRPSTMERVIDLYGHYRLLTFDRDQISGEPTVEIAHEALIRVWPRLRGWLDESRENLHVQRKLTTAAADWAATGHDASFLASGARLAQFENLAYSNLALNADELAYLDISVATREAQQAQEEAIRQRELLQTRALATEQQRRAEEQARANQRLHRRALWLAVAMLLALGAALFAGWQQQRANGQAALAERQARLALARQIMVQLLSIPADEVALRLLLSTVAIQTADTLETRVALLDALERAPHLYTILRGHTGQLRSVAFSPDGSLLASAGEDTAIILWDVAARRAQGAPLRGHTNWINSVAFSPDGKLLASASDDQAILLWDVATRQPVGAPLLGHNKAVLSIAFSPDGALLASASADKTIILWDVATHRPLGASLQAHTDKVSSVAFSPDGKLLASAGADTTIIVWDVATRRPLGSPLRGHSNWVYSLGFSPDGKLLASAGADTTIIVWDVATHQPTGAPLQAHADRAWNVAFSPDGKLLASAGADKTIVLWDMTSDQQLATTLRGHTDRVQSVAFSPDNRLLASGSSDTTIILWDVTAHEPASRPLRGHSSWIFSVAFSPDGTLLASGSGDKTIILWDVTTHQPIGPPLTGHTDTVNSVAFSPDGKLLASGSDDGTIRLWDVAMREVLGDPLRGPTYWVNKVVFSPDGQLLASDMYSDGNGQSNLLWDVATRQPVGPPLKGDTSIVYALAFSPDGKILAGGGDERSILLWDVATHQPLAAPLQGSSDPLSVAFSPDGRQLASGNLDSTITLWEVGIEQWQARACRIANRNLTKTEWEYYIGADVPYRPACPGLPVSISAPPETRSAAP